MTDHLNITLALAEQAYDELISLVPLAELRRHEFGTGQKRERVTELLNKLNTNINSIHRVLSDNITSSTKAPILHVPPSHRAFYKEVILPHGKFLQLAYLEVAGLSILSGLLDEPAEDTPKPLMLNAISWGLQRWNDMLEQDEAFEWYERGFNIEGAHNLVETPWFQPDQWWQNQKYLTPILVDRSPQVMRDHVRYRLTEIYLSYTYGLWMAAIALSRSLVEFSLKANAPRLSIIVNYTGASGRRDDKSFKQLSEEVAGILPELAAPLETVRDTGNRILHPKKQDVIAHPKVMRDEAFRCIDAATLIVETLYSEVHAAK